MCRVKETLTRFNFQVSIIMHASTLTIAKFLERGPLHSGVCVCVCVHAYFVCIIVSFLCHAVSVSKECSDVGNYRSFLRGPFPVANYTLIVIPGSSWPLPLPTTNTYYSFLRHTPQKSLIRLARSGPHPHPLECYLTGWLLFYGLKPYPKHLLDASKAL